MNNVLVRLSAVMIFGISWVVAWEEVLFSETWPGDSITAAMVLLVPVMLQFVIPGREHGQFYLQVRVFKLCFVSGLVLFIVLMLVPLLSGDAMLTSFRVRFGSYHLSSTLLFEIAIFLIMTGVVVNVLAGYKEPD